MSVKPSEVSDGEDEKEEKVEKKWESLEPQFCSNSFRILKRTWQGIYTLKFKDREIKDTSGGEEEDEEEEAGKDSIDEDEEERKL